MAHKYRQQLCGAMLLATFVGGFAMAAAASPAAFYVAPDGDDTHDGSLAHPFATIAHAVAAMRGSRVRCTVVDAGHYHITSTINLGPRDSGVRLMAAPGPQPVLDGEGASPGGIVALEDVDDVTVQGLGFINTAPGSPAVRASHSNRAAIVANHFSQVGTAILLLGTSNSLVAGNAIEDAAHSGIEASDQSDRNLIDSNIIDGAGGPETHGGGIMLHGATGNGITHNVVENTGGMGIGVENWDAGTINRHNTVAFNVVRNVDLAAVDSGAIYVLGRSRIDTSIVIAGNMVDGSGPATAHGVGIYLDDSTSGAAVYGNIVRHAGSDGLQIHGGSNNRVEGNVFDLGTGTASAMLFQAAPADTHPDNAQAGNTVRANVILSARRDPKIFVWLDGGRPTISGNLYFNTLGAAMPMPAQATDTAPRNGDPRFANAPGGDYRLLPGSAALGITIIDQHSMGLRPPTDQAYRDQ